MTLQIDLEVEGSLRSLLVQLQAECGIYEIMVYKNKNQHRRSSYFQYLLKVRRDLRLLHLASLGDVLDSCMLVLTGNRPKPKSHRLERWLSQYESSNVTHNVYMCMTYPELVLVIIGNCIAAIPLACQHGGVSTLLARSFMGFSMMILALLARLKVLVQQVYREFYPKTKEYIPLECLWKADKFALVETIGKCEMRQEADVAAEMAVQYQKIESFLGDHDDELSPENADASRPVNESSKRERPDKLFVGGTPIKKKILQAELLASASSSKLKWTARKVAFVSVKRPNPSTTNQVNLPQKNTVNGDGDKADAFYSLLTGGNLKDGVFCSFDHR